MSASLNPLSAIEIFFNISIILSNPFTTPPPAAATAAGNSLAAKPALPSLPSLLLPKRDSNIFFK